MKALLMFCITAVWLLTANCAAADFLFADDFEEGDFNDRWTILSNWEVKEEGENHILEKLDDSGQVDLEIKDMTFTAPFTVQMRINQVSADAGAHVAIYTSRNPFTGYIYGFNSASVVEWNPIAQAREEFPWQVDPDTWVTYKVLAEAGSARCYYRIDGEQDFTLSHDKGDVGY